jgi:hypothetical protein
VGGVAVRGGHDLGVGVHGHRDGGVAEPFGDDLDGHAPYLNSGGAEKRFDQDVCVVDTDVAAMTLDAYLDEWLTLLHTRAQATTHQSYDDMTRSYLRPRLGRCLVGELTVHQLDLHFVHLQHRGGRRGGPLKRKTVTYAHAILRQALGEAVRDGLLTDNVAARSTPPRLDPERAEGASLRSWTLRHRLTVLMPP